MSTKPHVLIAGAGIGGLSAALALLQRGHDVDVYEQAPELKEVGAGVQLAANGTRLLIEMGLRERLEPLVCEAAGKEVRLWNSGQTWKLFDLGEDSINRFGAPYWMVHRADLHGALRDAVEEAKPGAIHLGKRTVGVRQDARTATLDFADGTSATGDIVVGADGVHSVLRDQIFGSAKPKFTGLMAWRGLAPVEALPEELQRPVGTNWVGPGGHVITYPIKAGKLMNFVGLVENREWTKEGWMEAGTTEECLADFENWNPLVRDIIKAMDTPYRWAMVLREPLTEWTDGRVTLLGDACHPTLPLLAQGAIMAIEDAVILARCLDAAPAGDPRAALRAYVDLRRDRTAAVVRGSAANVERFHNPALAEPVAAVDYIEREWQPEQVRRRYDWLFEYDARTVGEIAAA